MSIADDMLKIGNAARKAAGEVAKLSSAVKDSALLKMADDLLASSDELKEANEMDLAGAREKGVTGAMLERLTLSDKVIESMAGGLRDVASLLDPVGEVTGIKIRPYGLRVVRMRIPLGVIGIIYESRPNVTADAAVLCLKSGNAVVLRGGSESINSNLAISRILRGALRSVGAPEAALQVVSTTDRAAVLEMLKLEEQIDIIIPRGGEGLIRHVVENSRIPVIKHYKGVCHVYVDDGAELLMAVEIAFNSKVQRPGVCNAMETLLVHEKTAAKFLPLLFKRYKEAGVEVRGCPKTRKILKGVALAKEEDWFAEYLDLTLAVKVVSSMEDAIGHIEKYGSLHTETIVTSDYGRAKRFTEDVNSSAVMVNASTRFNDGNELGLGAEIGISTTKLHAFGPMGLEELTTRKFVVFGEGQIRS